MMSTVGRNNSHVGWRAVFLFLALLQRVGREGETAADVYGQSRNIPILYAQSATWSGTVGSGATQVKLQLHGLDGALLKASAQPTTRAGAHFTWEIPAGAPRREQLIAISLKSPRQELPSRLVAVAPVSRGYM